MGRTRPRTRVRALILVYGLLLASLWGAWRFAAQHGDGIWTAVIVIGGIAWLAGATYHTLKWYAYGDVHLDIGGKAHPGGKLVAVLRVPKPIDASRLTARLQCKEIYATNVDGHRSFAETVVWAVESDIALETRWRRSECRIEFDVPENALLTTGVSSVWLYGPKDYS